MHDTDDVGVFLGLGVFRGLDVGESAHHGHGLTPAGKKVFDKQLPNSEPLPSARSLPMPLSTGEFEHTVLS
ncbi:hypothetical protein [Streptomyces inhibens]|uniref:hypothetical protein n=1 Tax=Streptomyces inhibens TaxID=2293571 RepID=UPI00247AC705|nr:hypothetical protein [Streptomyces inhibens]